MRSLRPFLKDRRGNFGVMTAILMVPLLGAAGLAVDYSDQSELRTELMEAADAAALGAISPQSSGYKAIQSMTGDGEVSIAEQDAQQMFMAQRSSGLSQTAGSLPINVSIKVAKQSGVVTSTVNFGTQAPTTFMKILGINSMPVSGTATASSGGMSSASYTDFYLLLDNTPSMGIGATQADIDALVKATANAPDAAGRNCAFACHMVWGSGVENTDSNYLIARANDITLRIDVVTEAVKGLMDDAAGETQPNQYRFAAYTFGAAASETAPYYGIQRIATLTGDLSTMRNAIGQINLMTTQHHQFNEDALTSFDTALTSIGKEIKTDGGTGASTGDRQEVVFFVTDGLGDSRKSSCTGGSWWSNPDRCLQPIDPKLCSALKDRGIKVAVLYTTYLPIPTDPIWNQAINPVFAKNIGPNLKACATEGLFFEVKPTDDMAASMSALFSKAASATSGLRLTN
ncbi:pilus assembly protein TadG-related protein [Rhizobium sp. RAF36]|jgi:Flp pilus assembly protein TadG|uniref:pilus assembly protein TadG-related protein n=1 Tax=Rhizobium sp. RAF36 TaxID=3233055 RepID=UPI000DD9810A